MTRWIQRTLFGAGCMALGLCGAFYLEAAAYQSMMGGRLARVLHLAGSDGAAGGEELRAVGLIEIPRLGLTAAIREGIGSHTLLIAVGHVPGTALPGETGNVVLSGHRDTFFRSLRHVRLGDTVTIVTGDTSFIYRVQSTSIVTPDRTDVLEPTEENTLTLITCYPFTFIGRAPKRFIVRARQIEPQARALRHGPWESRTEEVRL